MQAFDLLAAAANTTAEDLLALPELTDILMYHVVPTPFANRLAFDQGSAPFPYGEHSAGTGVCWPAEHWPQPGHLLWASLAVSLKWLPPAHCPAWCLLAALPAAAPGAAA